MQATAQGRKAKTAIDAKRSDMFLVEPERLTLITDPDHPLYDPRVEDPPDEAMVKNVMYFGVLEPILIRKNGDAIEVVAGRGRVKAALEANRRLDDQGHTTMKVPAILKRDDDANLLGMLVTENELRRENTPLAKSNLAKRLEAYGKTRDEIATICGVTRQCVDNWLSLQNLAPAVRDDVEAGKIPATVALKVAHLPRDKQVDTINRVKDSGGKVTVDRVKRAVRTGDPSPLSVMKTRREIEDELRDARKAAECDNDHARGYVEGLEWVLGIGGGE